MNVCAIGSGDEELTLRVDRTMEILMAASGEDWSKMARLSELVRNGLTIVMAALGDQACLVDLRRIFTDEDFRYQLLDQVGLDAQEAVSFWKDQFESWNQQADALAPVMRRLSPILNNSVMRPMLGLPGNTLDIGGFLDQGMLVLAPLMAGLLQARNKNTLGTLVVQQILTAILARAGLDKKARGLVGIFIDEFPDFAGATGEAVNILLAQARKFGASVVLAAQSLSQLATNVAVMNEVETNCRNKVIYASDAKDAKRAVELLGASRLLSPDDVVRAGKFRGYVRPTVERSPVPPAYVRFLPPVGSIIRLANGVRPEPLPVPPHPGKSALELALNAYKAYRGHTARGQERAGRDKVSEFLSGLSDADWEGYKAGREFLFTHLYNRLLAQRMPSEGQEKVARMKALTALRIGVPVYERDAEYKKRLGSTSKDDWGGDGW
jgi:hypothetical protein